eukprot:CAMPEP_0113881054 /NCGR_PEP_ID=MMETSP0780_2-20120614/8148_1 /TAXON_ID=652834 /ORGANISM="Palpitomonas bilix" /LENGTH=79 /DNA_ID=CAMNT_0000867839 /DNA_START=1200 /DNA_END=1439 /DNA_ORIENTATION=+ /assembly_acc=CAM_ASM_000599
MADNTHCIASAAHFLAGSAGSQNSKKRRRGGEEERRRETKRGEAKVSKHNSTAKVFSIGMDSDHTRLKLNNTYIGDGRE